MKYVGVKFRRKVILLDGDQFVNCSFDECRLQYAGTVLPYIMGCKFGRNDFSFVGSARLTIDLMKALYHEEFFRHLIEQFIAQIKGATPGLPPVGSDPFPQLPPAEEEGD